MAIWGPVYFQTSDTEVPQYRVKIYGQPVTTANKLSDAHVTFKYGDLINRAIRATQVDSKYNVRIDFAIYRLARKVYIGFDHEDKDTYGTVAGEDHGNSSTEKLLYSLIKAARAGVTVRFIVQKDGVGDAESDDISDLTDYLNDPGNWGGEYREKNKNLSVRHVTWGVASNQQMHNKFILVSHVRGNNDNIYRHCTYTTTANVDPWENYKPKKKYYQTGVTVYDHRLLYEHYQRYFDLFWEHCGNHGAFKEAVIDAHETKPGLNYANPDDPYIRAYFYPVRRNSAWETRFNPGAWMLEMLQNQHERNRYIKINMAFLRDDFWGEFCTRMDDVAGHSNLDVKIKTHDDGSTYGWLGAMISPGVIYPDWVDTSVDRCETHTKNYQFVVYDEFDEKQYCSITGSVNAKMNGYFEKANNTLLIKDKATSPDNVVYRAFKDMYEDVS